MSFYAYLCKISFSYSNNITHCTALSITLAILVPSSGKFNCRLQISIVNNNLKSHLSIPWPEFLYSRSWHKIPTTSWTNTRATWYVMPEGIRVTENVSMQSVNESLKVNNKVSGNIVNLSRASPRHKTRVGTSPRCTSGGESFLNQRRSYISRPKNWAFAALEECDVKSRKNPLRNQSWRNVRAVIGLLIGSQNKKNVRKKDW